MPFVIQTDNGKNFCSKEFEEFAEKDNKEVTRCAPYRHQGNGQAEQSVNTLKQMIKKEKKTKVERLCHDLNHIRRMGCQASPMEMFFNRPVKGLLPNQFAKENEIRKSLERRISNQFKLALKKGRFSRDSFQEGDRVRI